MGVAHRKRIIHSKALKGRDIIAQGEALCYLCHVTFSFLSPERVQYNNVIYLLRPYRACGWTFIIFDGLHPSLMYYALAGLHLVINY